VCACVFDDSCIRGAKHNCGLMRACVQALTAIRLPCSRAVSCPQFAFDSLRATCTFVADVIFETMLPLNLPSERVQATEGNPHFFCFESLSNPGCRCRRYPLKDVEQQEIIPFFSQATDFINEAQQSGGKLLLHCHEGKSRSITLALAYLMQTKDWTLKEALEFVTQHRPCASPNAGFMTQLLKLEQKLHGKKTVKVRHWQRLCLQSWCS